MNTESICVGCLSDDRKVFKLDNGLLQVYNDILEVTSVMSTPLVCFECCSILKKINRFRKQAKHAHNQLKNYKLTQSKPASLSSLQSHTNTTRIEMVHTDIEVQVKCEMDDNVCTFDDLFVSDYYVGDEFMDSKDAIKHLELTPDLPEDIVKAPTNKRKKKAKSYSDSDDEPLTVKKKKRATVKKGRVKKKKREDDDKEVKEDDGFKIITNARVKKCLQSLNIPLGHIEMVLLNWDQVQEERQRALTNVSFTRHEYRCYKCILGFNHKFKLDNHMKKHDVSSGAFSCEVCDVRCKDSNALGAHKRRHQLRWRCAVCFAFWSRAGVAADHYSREHNAAPATHVCHVCGYTATTLGKLRNHLKDHSERQKCEMCGKSFRDRTSLKTHLFTHRKEKEFSCNKCDKRFHFKKAMEIHMLTHEASAQMYCVQCDVNFKNRMSFYQHMKYNLKHIDPAKLKHTCTICGACFSKACRLLEHKASVHSTRRHVPCSVTNCDYRGASRACLRSHMWSHHSVTRIRRHVCHQCGKAYTSKKSLEGHIRSHTGERPYSCDICTSTFTYQAALYNHNKLVHHKAKKPKVITETSTDEQQWEANKSTTNENS